ncbi:MAG: BMP family ABC transporter substrate-binding protein [Spirochaetales bacterium]
MKKTFYLFIALLLGLALVGLVLSCGGAKEPAKKAEQAASPAKTLKAGFLYIGPVGDYGWSHAHDVGRKFAESQLPWLKTVIVESVPEGDAMRIIDRLVNEEKCDVIFTTSFGYMDDTVKAAEKYKNTFFFHCSGFKRAPNLGTYFAELYQMYYLNGLMAGVLTETNKVGYVGAFPISEVIRHINAYALGVKEANPKAKVEVRWIFSWYDPAKAKEAAQALVSAGADALAFTEDSPSVIEVGQEHTKKGKKVYSFSHYSPMQKFGEDSAVSGQLVDWGPMYVKILTDVYNGQKDFSNYDLWWLAAEKAALLGGEINQPINPKFVDVLKSKKIKSSDLGELNAYDYILKRYEQVKANQFEPFTGPIKDQKGAVRIPAGQKADAAHLLSIEYFVDNVVGEIPRK